MIYYHILTRTLLCTRRFVWLRKREFVNRITSIGERDVGALASCKQFSSVPDAIDIFAEKLVQDKVEKWRHIKSRRKNQAASCVGSGDGVVGVGRLAALGAGNVQHFVSRALRDGRHGQVVGLVRECRVARRGLPPECLLEAASLLARLGSVDGVEAVRLLCRETDTQEYSSRHGYENLLAEALWFAGNSQEALGLLTKLYDSSPGLHKAVKATWRFLVSDLLNRRGEAVLVLVTRFAEDLARRHGELHFLAVLWKSCFLGGWHADHVLAATLLDRHPGLRAGVAGDALEMSFVALKGGRSEVVYRLLEVLLRYEMRSVYSQVLHLLFDYKCDRGDVRACCELMRCCEQLSVALTAGQQHRFICLVVNTRPAAAATERRVPPPQFTLKF